MADPADLGNDRAAQQLDAALSRVLGKSGPETHPGFDGKNCIGCSEPIPQGRLLLHKVYCILCQTQLEARRARGLA